MGRSAKLHKRFSRKERDYKKIVKNSMPEPLGGAKAGNISGDEEPDVEVPISRNKKLRDLAKEAKKSNVDDKLHTVKAGKIAKPAPGKTRLPKLGGEDSDMDDAEADSDGEVPWYIQATNGGTEAPKSGPEAAKAPKEKKFVQFAGKATSTDEQPEPKPKGYILAGRKDYVDMFQKGPRKKSYAAKVVNFFPGRIV
jgi:hypothetical protein